AQGERAAAGGPSRRRAAAVAAADARHRAGRPGVGGPLPFPVADDRPAAGAGAGGGDARRVLPPPYPAPRHAAGPGVRGPDAGGLRVAEAARAGAAPFAAGTGADAARPGRREEMVAAVTRQVNHLPVVCQLLHGLRVGGAEVLAARIARRLCDEF